MKIIQINSRWQQLLKTSKCQRRLQCQWFWMSLGLNLKSNIFPRLYKHKIIKWVQINFLIRDNALLEKVSPHSCLHTWEQGLFYRTQHYRFTNLEISNTLACSSKFGVQNVHLCLLKKDLLMLISDHKGVKKITQPSNCWVL